MRRRGAGMRRHPAPKPGRMRISGAALYGLTVEEEIQRAKLMMLPVTLEGETEIPTYGMLDTGAEGKAFIDELWARDHNIELFPLKKPLSLETFEGKEAESGQVTHYARISMRVHDHRENRVTFLSTSL